MVAIYWHPDAYDTSGKALMGRQSAGEGFFRGYLRHSAEAEITLFNAVAKPPAELEPLVRQLGPVDKPIRWVNRGDMGALRGAGVFSIPVPGLASHAWARALGDVRAFSICGITHTTITQRVLDIFVDNRMAPTQPWDALICTSRAVRASVEVQNEMLDDYLRDRLGATRIPKPEYPVIPLGVITDDFARSPQARRRWRDELGIGEDDVAALYVGRFNWTSKMNPAPMAMALERASARTSRTVHWILAGWADEGREQEYKDAVAAHTDKVRVHWVDGRPVENRRSIWSAGDLFISLCDNMQETFGLTPIEAMAAGLPCVISDWDGYKDTVRHGVDGYRIATFTPPAGLGRDLAFQYGQDWLSYDLFVGAISQLTSVDLDAAARALHELIESPDLRRRMGDAALARARSTYDWGKIIPQYEALWAELDTRRKAAPPEAPRTRNQSDNPWRPDPFRMFAGYPTEWATSTSMLTGEPGMTWEAAQALMTKPLVRGISSYQPTNEDVKRILEMLATTPQLTLGEVVSRFPPPRRPFMERGVVWMAKYGMLRILGRSSQIAG